MEEQKKITSLPAELIHAVAKEANKVDVLSLRAVCRDLAAKADDAFIDLHFTKRCHLLTWHSLKALIKITRRQRLRRKLQVVEFVIAYVDDEEWEPEEDPISNAVEWRASRGKSPLSAADRETLVRQNDEMRRVWPRWKAHLKALQDAGGEIRMLSTILRNMASENKLLDLSLTTPLALATTALGRGSLTPLPSAATPYGYRTFVKGLQLKEHDQSLLEPFSICPPDPSVPSAALKRLLKGIANAQVSLERFQVKLMDRNHDFALFHLNERYLSGLKIAFTNLRALSIRPFMSIFPGDSDGLHHLTEIVQAAPRLTELSLTFEDWSEIYLEEKDYRLRVLNLISCSKLTELRLAGGRFFADELLTMLQLQQKTLSSLRLRRICLDSADSWRSLFAHLAETFTLIKFDTSRLFFGVTRDDALAFRVQDSINVEGQDAVKAGLQGLIEVESFRDYESDLAYESPDEEAGRE